FYQEIMGREFELKKEFVQISLKKWLPRLNEIQNQNLTESILHLLEEMRQGGKSQDMQRNAYIKFMCWLYYKFERILIQLGQEQIPKILYEGIVSKYELDILTILANAGCDILLLEKQGDLAYQSVDLSMDRSFALEINSSRPFPDNF